ncbi:MAG: hypothetical protein ACHP7D_10865 [Lysobacterales bacterium]
MPEVIAAGRSGVRRNAFHGAGSDSGEPVGEPVHREPEHNFQHVQVRVGAGSEDDALPALALGTPTPTPVAKAMRGSVAFDHVS